MSTQTEHRGLFVAVEGPDGSGKSTQARALTEALRAAGHEVVLTREPGGSDLGETLRELLLDPGHAPVDPRTEALLFAAARSAHAVRTLRPALARGAVVVTDRYVDSSVAYQGAARGLGEARIAALNEWATDGLVPDLTVLIDVDAATAADRRERRAAGGEGAHATLTMPGGGGVFAPIVHAVPMQLLAYHTAVAKGTDVDQPRNLAKSVTVE